MTLHSAFKNLHHFFSLSFLLFYAPVFAGIDIRTSSIIEYPGVEVLGYHNGSWYAIGFELPGNLNKPPRFQLFRYAAGFKSGKTSVTYNSFGEKTYYIRSAFVNNKVSLFYAVCEKRVDSEFMLEQREGHKLLPVIMRQDFDATTLESLGLPEMIYDEKDEYFTASGIEVVESDDKSKVAILIKPYYKQYKYKVIWVDNKTGSTAKATFDFKWRKEYLQFMQARLSNVGQLYLATKVRTDVISINTPPKNKPQNTYYFFSLSSTGDTAAYKLNSPVANGQYLGEPTLEVLKDGSAIAAFDYYNDARWKAWQGTSVLRLDMPLSNVLRSDFVPDQKFLPQVAAYRPFKKGSEYTNLTTRQILPLPGKSFLILTEYTDTLPPLETGAPPRFEFGYMIATLVNDNMQIAAQHFIAKKQISATVAHAFSCKAYAKGSTACIFYNADWLADDENNMNLYYTQVGLDGAPPVQQKVVNTSNEFYTCVPRIYAGTNNNVMFREEKLVDFGDITRQVKLLEITLK